LPGNAQPERMKNRFVGGILQITIPKNTAEESGRSED